MNTDKFIDTCRLLGNYNGENIYLGIQVQNMTDQDYFILLIIITYLNGLKTMKN